MGQVPYKGHVYLLPWRWRHWSLLSRSCPTSSLLSFPAAAILECWMWRGEAGTGDESSGERGVRQEREKKNPTNFNYAFIYKRNKELFGGHRQRVLSGKETEIFLPSSGASQCKWWCVNGALLKTEEKYGMRMAYHLTWLALAVSSHWFYPLKYLYPFGIPFKYVI